MRLLVVEDEPRIAELLRSALGRAGFVADTVVTCADARATLALNPYDAAILDLGLPDGDGVDFIRGLRSWSEIPVIVLSARTDEAQKIAALDAGAAGPARARTPTRKARSSSATCASTSCGAPWNAAVSRCT